MVFSLSICTYNSYTIIVTEERGRGRREKKSRGRASTAELPQMRVGGEASTEEGRQQSFLGGGSAAELSKRSVGNGAYIEEGRRQSFHGGAFSN
ncbi:hypothetical protein TorRG33x02_174880 [Trema orientale]|uniref:Uncharacterized protein n=1 Tax=Trema orientale TaxID=63057 RepID=A0A2P5EMA4_TREOI|nr:hypothetical protein TorRG33x02_174880 [Trema orientale]